MYYHGYFTDIEQTPYSVLINTHDNSSADVELTLDDNPVTISWDSPEGIYSPIKSCSCSIRIRSKSGLFNLYTSDPWGIEVSVWKGGRTDPYGTMVPATHLFHGYATPYQYNQSWTYSDVITLECVDTISVLKDIPYTVMPPKTGEAYIKHYRTFPDIFKWIISQSGRETFNFYTPMYTILGCNSHPINDFRHFLERTYFNEANFFDDDDEKTPWTCYQVIEEFCRYFNLSLVPWQNSWYFIDYCYAAFDDEQNRLYEMVQWSNDLDQTSVALNKSMVINRAAYVAGSPDLSMDKIANIYNVETNRYDIDEITNNMSSHDTHTSITKERNFSESQIGTVWTETKEKFWTSDEIVSKWMYKTYCRFNPYMHNWTHKWWIPYNHQQSSNYYNIDVEGRSNYTTLPENKYINTLGAFPMHYAAVDDLENKPTSLSWNDCVMFTCMHDTIQTANLPTGMFNLMNYGSYEKESLSWEGDYEMCFSPKDGDSYLVIDCKLWYQQNLPSENPAILPTDMKKLTSAMFPIEDVTDHEAYTQTISKSGHNYKFQRIDDAPYFGTGFELLKMSLQVGNKYWNGSQWTTTASTFGLRFASRFNEKVNGTEREFEGFRYLEWMSAISNSSFEDGIGKEGYCIPIHPSDGLSGQVKVKIYMPRLIAYNDIPEWWKGEGNIDWNLVTFYWYELGPVVFMKDFNIDYVYVDNEKWYLSALDEKKDVKYTLSSDKAATWKREDNVTCQINSWQTDRPISKSFPVIDVYQNGKKEYVQTTMSGFDPTVQEQEYNIIEQRMRHYSSSKKIYEANVYRLVEPWAMVTTISSSGLNETGKDNIFVLDKQEYDVRNRNIRATLVEFGDSTIHQNREGENNDNENS